MDQRENRRSGDGRRDRDARKNTVLRTVSADLVQLRRQVDSARAERGVPAALRQRLDLIDRELRRITELTHTATAQPPTETVHAHGLAEHLTQREWQCLALMVRGMNTRAMAVQLTVSDATVRTHVQSVLVKLGVNSRLEAVALTMRTALLQDTQPR